MRASSRPGRGEGRLSHPWRAYAGPGLAFVLALFAAPAWAERHGTGGNEPAQEGQSGNIAAALDRLFDSLREAHSPEVARGIEQLIWSIWLDAGSEEADRLIDLATSAMSAGDYPRARSHLDAIIAAEPDFAEAWNKRATVHFLEGDYGRSLEDIRQVLALEPRHFGALSGLGQIFELTGRKKEALEAFRRTLAVHPQLPVIRQRVEILAREVEGREL